MHNDEHQAYCSFAPKQGASTGNVLDEFAGIGSQIAGELIRNVPTVTEAEAAFLSYVGPWYNPADEGARMESLKHAFTSGYTAAKVSRLENERLNRDVHLIVAAIGQATRTVAAAALAAEAWSDQTAVERAKFYWEQSGK